MRRIIAGIAVIGVAWLALAQGQTLNRGVYEQGTNTIVGPKFFLNGLWIGTNVQVTVNSSTQLVSVVNGVTNLLGSSGTDSNTVNLMWWANAATGTVANASLFNGHSMLEDAPGGFTPYFLTGNTLLGVKTTTWSSPATMLGYLAVAGALTNGGNATLGTLNVGTITGNGSGLTNIGYATSSGIASNLHSGAASTGQVATANGSGGTFWATPAAGGAATGMRVMLTPGGALTFGSVSNALIVGTASATGYGINTDTLQFDPTTPQLAPWQMPVIAYTGGAVNVAVTWSEPAADAKTNVWELWTAQSVSNAVVPTTWVVSAVITQQVNQTTNALTVWTGTITPSWTNNYPAPAFFGLFRNSTNTSDNAASTSSVYGVTLWQ